MKKKESESSTVGNYKKKKRWNISCSTLSSALRRTWLSGEAPSRLSHWSRISSGSQSSCLTGTTKEPIGNAQLWESWRTAVKSVDAYLLYMLCEQSTCSTHTWLTRSSLTKKWMQCTLTTRMSSVGSRTGKQKASFHWGEVVRSLTFRTETSLFSQQDLCNYDNKNSPFPTGLKSYRSFVGEFSESNLSPHFWFLATLLKLSAQKQITINADMQQTWTGSVFKVMCED